MHQPGRYMDQNDEIEVPNGDLRYFLPLYKAVIKGDWGAIRRFLAEDPKALTAPITVFSETTLHVAVRKVSKLVELMKVDSLQKKQIGMEKPTSLCWYCWKCRGCKNFVIRIPDLAQILNHLGETPLPCAARFGHKETVRFLLQETDNDYPPHPLTGEIGVRLLNHLIAADFYDIALDLLKRFPGLAAEADTNKSTALITLAQKPHAFESGNKFGFLQRLLFRVMPPRGDKVLSMRCGFQQHKYDVDLMQSQALELAKLFCEAALQSPNAEDILSPAILKAADLGIHQLVTEIIKVYPDSVWFSDQEGRSIFHLAILSRRVEVFNLLYEMNLDTHNVLHQTDNKGNNIMHFAGHLGPKNKTLGPDFQMKLDLEWFGEVQKLVQPSYKKMKNKKGETPEEIFAKEHEELARKREKWMTQVASFYAFAASLVITVVFVGPFNVPGGNNNDGVPNFLHESSFMVFMVSDGLALFFSSISLLMFVSVVCSHDFVQSAPRKMSIGFTTLLISIASMLVAFGSSLYMVLVHRVGWVGVPISLLGCVPATVGLVLLYPLILKIVRITFSPGIFRHKKQETVKH